MTGFRRTWQNKKESRRNVIFFRKGYVEGVLSERERIVSELLKDAVIITNLDIELLEKVVEIVEG
jgi:hypothetical protein